MSQFLYISNNILDLLRNLLRYISIFQYTWHCFGYIHMPSDMHVYLVRIVCPAASGWRRQNHRSGRFCWLWWSWSPEHCHNGSGSSMLRVLACSVSCPVQGRRRAACPSPAICGPGPEGKGPPWPARTMLIIDSVTVHQQVANCVILVDFCVISAITQWCNFSEFLPNLIALFNCVI